MIIQILISTLIFICLLSIGITIFDMLFDIIQLYRGRR